MSIRVVNKAAPDFFETLEARLGQGLAVALKGTVPAVANGGRDGIALSSNLPYMPHWKRQTGAFL
jgi:hypothetical protein